MVGSRLMEQEAESALRGEGAGEKKDVAGIPIGTWEVVDRRVLHGG